MTKNGRKKVIKSKLELLEEANLFANLLSNEMAMPTKTKIEISLRLADLTMDVNHLLGALIYLLQSIQKDLNSLIFGANQENAEV